MDGVQESDERTVNDVVLRVVGMSRSGNHAIINWILRQHGGGWLFLNCTEPEQNPYRTARPVDGRAAFLTDLPGVDLRAEAAGRFGRKRLLMYSHEDTFLKKAFGARANALERGFVGPARRRLDLLILRDPYNLFASRRQFGRCVVTESVALRIWKQHAKAFLDPPRAGQRSRIAVSYNAWCNSQAYRRALAERLGLQFTDSGIDEVPAVAEGSSFDGVSYCGRASQMPVLHRWQDFWGDPAFHALFDEQTHRLSQRLFGILDRGRPLA